MGLRAKKMAELSEQARADIRDFLDEFKELDGENIMAIKNALRALVE